MGRFLAVLALLAASVPLGPATVLQPVNLLSESVFLRHAKLIGSEVQVWTETHSSEGTSKLWMSVQSLSQCIALFTREPCHAELADVILFFFFLFIMLGVSQCAYAYLLPEEQEILHGASMLYIEIVLIFYIFYAGDILESVSMNSNRFRPKA